MARLKNGNSTAGAGSRSAGREIVTDIRIQGWKGTINNLGNQLNLSLEAQLLIQESTGLKGRVERDGSIFIQVPGLGRIERVTAPPGVITTTAKVLPKAQTANFKQDANGQWVKVEKEGIRISGS